MKTRRLVVWIAAALAGCGTVGSAEDFTWSIDAPKAVDQGAEFRFTVKASTGEGPVDGLPYRYQILWPGGSTNPLRHKARTGDAQKVHARLAAGTATLVVTCENRARLETKVVETNFEVH